MKKLDYLEGFHKIQVVEQSCKGCDLKGDQMCSKVNCGDLGDEDFYIFIQKSRLKVVGVNLSRSQWKTLLYYAHFGASKLHREYTKVFPNRETPYQKVKKIEDALNKQGIYR